MRWLAVVAVAVLGEPAIADPQLVPITSRNYAIDLYDGVALGNSAVIAMGGATVANAVGSSGSLANPAAPAVRQTTDTDVWSWDYHLDYLNASQSRDFANTGLANQTGGASMATAGISLRVRDWAGALTASWQTATLGDQPVALGNGTMANLDGTTLRARLAVAHWFPTRDVAIGAAAEVNQLSIKPDCTGPGCAALFTIQGGGLEAGATYIPRLENYRLGVSGVAGVSNSKVTVGTCDPMNCDGFILPDALHVPWRLAAGAAYRWSQSEWNQQVGGHFRDEPSVTVAADAVVTGPSPDAYGLDAFAQKQLERSGRHTAWSVRGGVEYEWLPGRLRVRGGSYWEPGRFEGVPGRVHGTFGIEVRVLEFHAWGKRRGRITLTGDVAERYDNVALSIGFWH